MSSATPLPYNVRYNADTGGLEYEFPTGWIAIGSAAPGTVVPSSITTSATADFVFPRDVTIGRNLIGSSQPMRIYPSVNSATAIQITVAGGGGTPILDVDTTTSRVGINTASPAQTFTVNGSMNTSGQLVVGGATTSTSCAVEINNFVIGLGLPRVTTAQKNAISPARAGNVVFDTDLAKMCVNNGATWETVTSV